MGPDAGYEQHLNPIHVAAQLRLSMEYLSSSGGSPRSEKVAARDRT